MTLCLIKHNDYIVPNVLESVLTPSEGIHMSDSWRKGTTHMAKGYAGKILEVNLSKDRISETSLDESILRRYIGGRGLAAKILWDRLGKKWRGIKPQDPRTSYSY